MPTSGTSTYNPSIVTIIEEAHQRAGREMRSGNDVRSARRKLDLMISEWANRGINLWTLDSGSISLVSSTATYSLPVDTVDILDFVIRSGSGAQQVDYAVERIGVGGFSAIVTKNTAGRPTQVFVQRTSTPSITLWPVPDVDTYTFVYWRLRRIQDSGAATNTVDIPHRFVPALVSGLAFYIAMSDPELERRVPFLKQEYEDQFKLAADEDRDRSSLFLFPQVDVV